MWPLLVEEPDLTFVDDPPPQIGEVVAAWTNNSKRGIKPVPVSLRLLIASGGLLLGLAVGLVAFFVIAGIHEHRGGHVEADWFLYALGAGGLAGLLVAMPAALRKPKLLTLFVGTEGCVQIARGRPHVLLFRDVDQIRDRISTTSFRGIRTSARELHVRNTTGRERLWYVSAAKDRGDDAQYAFGDAVLRAFGTYRSARTGK